MGIWRIATGILQQEERWVQAPRQPRGVPTGLAALDALTHGLRPREVTLLAARTSHGKSALALTIAVNVVKWEVLRSLRERRVPGRVLYLSPEMHPEQLLMRLASAESRVDLEVIQDGIALPEQRRRWREALESLEPLDPFLVIEGGQGMDINDVESAIRSHHAEHPLVLVVIDYLQRLSYGVVDDDYRRLSLISQTIKDLANETGVPFLVVSQLNRQIERDRHQVDRLPDLSDLRGSGRLEEDADNVWILWRPPKLSTESASAPQSAKLLVAKARSGKVGEVDLWFYPRIVSFVDSGSGRVRADGGLALHSVAGEPLPNLVELGRMLGEGRERGSGSPVSSDGPEQADYPEDPDDGPTGSASELAGAGESGGLRFGGVEGSVLDRLEDLAEAFRSWLESGAPAGSRLPVARATGGEAGQAGGDQQVSSGGLVFWCREPGTRRGSGKSRKDSGEGDCEDAGDPASKRAPPKGRRRGAEFEKRLARRLGAYRWPGLDGDIETPQGWRLECKYREGLVLDRRDELRYWLEQVYDYAARWQPGKRWALALTGGRRYRKGQVYVLMPLEFWWELVCAT
ncbi:AAA family ATPase [Thermomicrobium sp. 4228-Ro]|uniref:DnaB-like helicase C-terminal domain-containing protein n=1 Tax=Thermomicrobium sp. 4228-Ro TaxID=2993937 RepID=UPI0022499A20|nr:DnaB-like helicase C-terminal domain-containing protein [Thermomicrobium sp. 4228-Ro]MCX2726021.1 AAA family ATPase [Thermomicrobium sp. 4228-Ro]